MIGGNKFAFNHCESLFKDIAVEDGYLYCGPGGSGHFVKMIHNGIEYGMMQSIAEGFEVMQQSEFKLDLEKVQAWMKKGAQPSDRVMRFLDAAGIMKRPKRSNPEKAIPRKERKAKEEEAAKAAGGAPAAEGGKPAEKAAEKPAKAEKPAEAAPAAS